MTKHLYFLMEVGTREFAARCLKACIAAERGLTVLIGFQYTLLEHAAYLPRGIYLSKGTNSFSANNMAVARQAGHLSVCCEEENFFRVLKDNPVSFSAPNLADVCDLYLAAGAAEERFLRSMYGASLPIARAGNARSDVLRPELRALFANETKAFKERFGRYILINSNLGIINSASGEPPEVQVQRWDGLGLFRSDMSQEQKAAAFDDFVKHDQANAQNLQAVLKLLSSKDINVVLRPHPGENADEWRKVVANLGAPNIHVYSDGSHIPAILSADLLVHTSCTTGVEALLLGVPALSIKASAVKAHSYYLSNTCNVTCADPQSAADMIDRHLAGDRFINDARPEMMTHLSDYLDAAEKGPLAAERIVDKLEALDITGARGEGDAAGAPKRALKIYQENKHFVENDYVRQKYGLTKEIFKHTFEQFQSVLKRFSGVEWAPLSDSVFVVRPRSPS